MRQYYEGIGITDSSKLSLEAIKEYHPKLCEVCETLFIPTKVNSKYCSKRCSNKKHRKRNTSTLIGRGNGRAYCEVSFYNCLNCGTNILHANIKSKTKRKTCSENCLSELKSKSQSDRLSKSENRVNFGRHRKSYLEDSFEKWLTEKSISFESEVHFRNLELNKSYYVDFLFKDINLVIELDGNQHKKTLEKDRIRDECLKRVYGLNVVRITHSEYKNKTRYEEICDLLGIAV